jgi:hypothetical protein
MKQQVLDASANSNALLVGLPIALIARWSAQQTMEDEDDRDTSVNSVSSRRAPDEEKTS